MKVVCINAKDRPKQVSPAEWLTEGSEYTITAIKRMNLQTNKIGYLLKEVQLSEASFPYELYDSVRFIPIEDYVKQSINSEELELSI